jgi:hypothetical protein
MFRRGRQDKPLLAAAIDLVASRRAAPGGASSRLAASVQDIRRWREDLAGATLPQADLAKMVLDESGYTAHVAGSIQVAGGGRPAGKPDRT